VAKSLNLGQILTFGGLVYRPPFTEEDQSSCARAYPRCTLRAKFCIHRFILWPCGGENPQILLFLDFGILWCRQLAEISVSGTRVHNYKSSAIKRY